MATTTQKPVSNSLFEQFGALFKFSNPACKCTLEKYHSASGNLICSFYIERLETTYDFFYTTDHGLTRNNSNSSPKNSSLIMEEFLSLNLQKIVEQKYDDPQTKIDISKLETFINQNGLFFEMPSTALH